MAYCAQHLETKAWLASGYCAGGGACRVDPRRDTLIAAATPIDTLDFASPVAGLGSKMGIDATNKWPAETDRQWGTPIATDEAVKKRIDEIWRELNL